MSKKIIECKHLTMSIDNHIILSDIMTCIDEDSITAILGQTGSGKTMLVKAMLGLYPKRAKISGQINYYKDGSGVNLVKLSHHKINAYRGSELLWIPQNTSAALNPLLTVKQQMLIPLLKNCRYDKKIALHKIRQIFESLDLVPVNPILDLYPYQLSGGMKVRLMIAIGIAINSRVILLDEPTKGLDERRCQQLIKLINTTREKFGCKFVIISHNLSFVKKYADHTIIMNLGQIIADGSNEQVFVKNVKPYTRALIAAEPQNGMEVLDYEL